MGESWCGGGGEVFFGSEEDGIPRELGGGEVGESLLFEGVESAEGMEGEVEVFAFADLPEEEAFFGWDALEEGDEVFGFFAVAPEGFADDGGMSEAPQEADRDEEGGEAVGSKVHPCGEQHEPDRPEDGEIEREAA